MRAKKLLVVAFCAAAVAGASAGAALAGEVKGPPTSGIPGNGTPPSTPNQGLDTGAPSHASSICAFSGLNDGNPPFAANSPTQSYGQDVVLGLDVPSPGEACGHGSNPESGK